MSFARVRALVVIGVLTVAAFVFVITALVRDSQGGEVVAQGCPPGAVLADVALPAPKDVKLKVFNGTGIANRGENVTEDFKNRRFQVEKPGNSGSEVEEVAVLRFGPQAVGAAQLLRAYFLNEAVRDYDAKRKGPVVDVVIGTSFKQLATPTEVNQALVELGDPEVPPGACAAPAKQSAA